MNFRSTQIFAFFLIASALALTSCDKKGEAIPFPPEKTELLPPSSEPLRFSEPKKFEWQINDSVTFEKPFPLRVDLTSVPTKPFYPDGFIPLEEPLKEIELVIKQDTVIDLKGMPSEPIKFTISILEAPVKVRARLPKLNKDASVGIFEFGEDQGLPGSFISALMEDSHGMMWIATDYGICRFDGEYIEIYDILDERFTGSQTAVLSMVEDENECIWVYTADMGFYVIDLRAGIVRKAFLIEESLRLNVGRAMTMDSKGMLWFGTGRGGVFIVDPYNYTVKSLDGLASISTVSALAEDGNENMWIGSDSSLFVVNIHSGQIQSILDQPTFSFRNASGLFCDSQNNIWVGNAERGVARISHSRETYQFLGEAHGVNNPVRHFNKGSDNKIWMSSNSGGVYVYDPRRESLKHLSEENALIDDQVFNSLLDSHGQMWIATSKGLNLMDTEGLMPNFLTQEDGLSWPNIWSFMEDKKGDLWLGGWQRMDIYDSKSNTIKRVDLALQLEKSINIPFEPKRMPSGNYLIKAPSIGFGVFDPDEETITKVTPRNGLKNIYHSACFVDRSGKIWTGTFRFGLIEVYDPKTNGVKRLTNEEGIIGDIVWGIQEDAAGQIWVGTDMGVNIINVEENTIRHLKEGKNPAKRNFGAFLIDEQDRLWMGTRTGILIADQSNELLTKIQPENGLISEEVYTLYQHDGIMYAGTEDGLTTFKAPVNFTGDQSVFDIKSYAEEQGLIFNNFNADAAIAYDDKLWWGIETEVLTVTDFPSRDTVPGKTFISGIEISDQVRNFYDYELARETYTELDTLFSAEKDTFYLKEQRPEESGWLNENDIQWDGLEGIYNLPVNLKIPFEQNYVSFQFTGTQLKNRNKTRYSYYLEGFDEEWSDLSADPYSKNYRNLPAGNYTFNVRSRTFDGVWSEPATFSFTILPHWTNTWWAWLLYIFTFIMVVGAIVQYRARALQKENALLEEKVNHRTAQLKKSVEDLKSTQSQLIQSEKMASLGELTAGIAHEIQNPLNFVNNFSEVSNELIDEMNEELDKGDVEEAKSLSSDIKQNLEKITHHGKRADAIVKGMLAHSRSGKGEKSTTDLNALAEEYLKLSYHGLRARDKTFNADFKTDFDPNLPKVNVVPQDIGRVLLNLINNAFQACAQSGTTNPLVTIKTQLSTSDQILVTITDNGPGISDSIKDKIFQPFFTTKPTGEGTGLGLSLSYDIVKAHGGDLSVVSKENEGSEFVISLPTD
ncbi:ATP-binding protein [Cryomorphaceae bacterium 1068]|nr:ATP-binding protein [Cryomorphaceae bacterium 1068]